MTPSDPTARSPPSTAITGPGQPGMVTDPGPTVGCGPVGRVLGPAGSPGAGPVGGRSGVRCFGSLAQTLGGQSGGRPARRAHRLLGRSGAASATVARGAPLELRAAERAQRPGRIGQSVAGWADPVQTRAAVRADQPFGVDAVAADRAQLVLLDLGQQALLGQRALVDLGQRLARAHDQVEDDGEDEQQRREEDDQRGREVRQDRVLGARLHVPEGPVRGPEPQQDDVDHDQLDLPAGRSGCRRSRPRIRAIGPRIASISTCLASPAGSAHARAPAVMLARLVPAAGRAM